MKTAEQIKNLVNDINYKVPTMSQFAENVCLIQELLVHDVSNCRANACSKCKCYNVKNKARYVNRRFC